MHNLNLCCIQRPLYHVWPTLIRKYSNAIKQVGVEIQTFSSVGCGCEWDAVQSETVIPRLEKFCLPILTSISIIQFLMSTKIALKTQLFVISLIFPLLKMTDKIIHVRFIWSDPVTESLPGTGIYVCLCVSLTLSVVI